MAQDLSATRVTGVTIKGELVATEDMTLDCAFEGAIDAAGHQLATGPGSRVNASIVARAVTVRGRLEGHITADLVLLASTADVDASIVAEKISVEDGARFTGPVNTERARSAGEVARHRLAQVK